MARSAWWLWSGSLLWLAGCSFLDTQLLLDKMNSPSAPAPPRICPSERAAQMTFAAVADAYFDQEEVGRWLAAAARDPKPIVDLYEGLLARSKQLHPAPGDNPPLELRRAVLPRVARHTSGELTFSASVWNLPRPAVCLQPPAQAEAPCDGSAAAGSFCTLAACLAQPRPPATACPDLLFQPGASMDPAKWSLWFSSDPSDKTAMVDAERFIANVASIAPSLIALRHVAHPQPTTAELEAGVVKGLLRAQSYLRKRSWPRTTTRPRTALVLSGGAGTGAFQAGLVNRLLGVLQKCRPADCRGVAIDLVVGTSTGALVGMLVDMFHTPGRENEARNLLRDKYTCTVDNDLYCGVSEPVQKLGDDVPGLVKFDEIEKLIERHWKDDLNTNATELVTMSVDYQSGMLHADSDQDPNNSLTKNGRVQSVLASIVEPLMSYPVWTLYDGDEKPLQGTFIDGGIRSGLPVMQAMRRGAARVITVSTSSLDPSPIARPENALEIVLRTIDLMVEQPRVAEPQQADLAATVRRMSEYNVCVERYEGAVRSDADRSAVSAFCERKDLEGAARGLEAAAAGWSALSPISQVASSWQAAWVYRSEKPIQGMAGYEFDPKGMRQLYLQGVDAFQDRCEELLAMMSVPEIVIKRECTEGAGKDARCAEERAFADLEECQAKKNEARRLCESR